MGIIMKANEPASCPQNQFFSRPHSPDRPNTLKFEQVEIGPTSFRFMLKENPRGRFLQITEKTEDNFYGLAIPSAGLEEFQKLLDGMIRAADEPPAVAPSATRGPSSLASEEVTLKSGQMQFEHSREGFLLVLKENPGGRFLEIIRKGGLDHQHLVIPAGGLAAFQQMAHEIIRAAGALPLPPDSALPPRKLVSEHILKSVTLQVGYKSFMLVLKENPRGRYLRFTEKSGKHFSCLFVDASGFAEFKQLLGEMLKAAAELPPSSARMNPPGVPAGENTLASVHMQVGDKTIVFQLKENLRGRFLCLVEKSPTHTPQTLIIPDSGLNQFQQQVDELVEISDKSPVGSLASSERAAGI
jgi:hypothetical protein